MMYISTKTLVSSPTAGLLCCICGWFFLILLKFILFDCIIKCPRICHFFWFLSSPHRTKSWLCCWKHRVSVSARAVGCLHSAFTNSVTNDCDYNKFRCGNCCAEYVYWHSPTRIQLFLKARKSTGSISWLKWRSVWHTVLTELLWGTCKQVNVC